MSFRGRKQIKSSSICRHCNALCISGLQAVRVLGEETLNCRVLLEVGWGSCQIAFGSSAASDSCKLEIKHSRGIGWAGISLWRCRSASNLTTCKCISYLSQLNHAASPRLTVVYMMCGLFRISMSANCSDSVPIVCEASE